MLKVVSCLFLLPFVVFGKVVDFVKDFISPRHGLARKMAWVNTAYYDEAVYALTNELRWKDKSHRNETEKLQSYIKKLEQERRGRRL